MLHQILPLIYSPEQAHIVLANGQFPTHHYLLQLLQQAKSVICCDGAVHKLLQHNIQPGYIIGDCDSMTQKIKDTYADKITLLPDQNSNDLTKALNFAKHTLSSSRIIILGATGLREDHTLGNIAILAELTPGFDQIAIISDQGIFTAHNTKTILKTLPGQQISFFTFDPGTSLNCPELKWPLNNLALKSWNSGTLNQASGNFITLTVTQPTIVYRSFEIKK